MHSIDLYSVSGESPMSYEDSVSSEGVPTPLEGPQSHLAHSELSIDIPHKITPPLIGTPFITDSSSLFEYPFPTSPRPPLSSASSASSVTSIPGPPSSATQDKHSSHILTRLSSRVGRTPNLSPIPIPPRLRRLSGHMSDESNRFNLSLQHAPEVLPSRDTVSARLRFSLHTPPGGLSGPALSSTPRACIDIPIASRRRSMPAVFTDSDDEHEYTSASDPVRFKL
ncbi:hypothetical protein V565_185720 [Rhizoctonia solani 123E]|uniref:Uncharacterized protein n=1 Tax=Rhizoctonia solani 123E TaxID=1423351 RepID=A0A074RIS8_9AGAM|nr:hypothetical protein V565_185720 [Rhizoctonia solani 123E]